MASKSYAFSMRVDFPLEVDLENIPKKEFSVWDLDDYQDMMFSYCFVNQRKNYYPIKNTGYRWLFFMDTYDVYDVAESKDLELTSVFKQKWYKNKYMTVIFLDKDMKYHKRVIPASKQEYLEEKEVFDKLYKILDKYDNYIGNYIKYNNESL